MSNDVVGLMLPENRFPGFRGPWSKTKLGELGTFFRGLTYGSGNVVSDGLLVVRSSNIQGGRLILDSDLVFVDVRCSPDSLLRLGDVVICMSNGSKALVGKSAVLDSEYPGVLTVGAFCSIFRPITPFAAIAFGTPQYEQFVATSIAGGNINNLKVSDLEAFEFSVPPSTEEQQKLADCLASLDQLVLAQLQKVNELKTCRDALLRQLFPLDGETRPRLRFPEFQGDGDWRESSVQELVSTVKPPKKLQTFEYELQGDFPVIDQSQDYICGWTSDRDAVVQEKLPLIVFGDHTCALKLVDQPFAQGADGIKILRPEHAMDPGFIYFSLRASPVAPESYKRHFSVLREKRLRYPDPSSGEQERISSLLSTMDTLVNLEAHKHELLKALKSGLVLRILPRAKVLEA